MIRDLEGGRGRERGIAREREREGITVIMMEIDRRTFLPWPPYGTGICS